MINYEAKLYVNVKDIIEVNNLFHFKAYPLYIIFGTVYELELFLSKYEKTLTKIVEEYSAYENIIKKSIKTV